MWVPLVFIMMFFFNMASAMSKGSWDEQLGMEVAFAEEEAVMEGFDETLSDVQRKLTLEDFLRVPFNPETDSQDKIIFDSIVSDPSFQAARAAAIRMNYYMDVPTYDRLHAETLTRLQSVAKSLNIPVQLTNSYFSLLSEVESALNKQHSSASFAELGAQVSALRSSAYLFEGRHTLLVALHEDAIAMGIEDKLGEAFDWLKEQIRNNKCSWCKGIASYIKAKACSAAGKFICSSVLSGIGGPIGALISKYVCGEPINLGKIFTKWCEKGIAALQNLVRASDACICSFKASITIPRVKIFKKEVGGFTLGSGEPVCPTNPGECVWHSAEDKALWDGTSASANMTSSLRKYLDFAILIFIHFTCLEFVLSLHVLTTPSSFILYSH